MAKNPGIPTYSSTTLVEHIADTIKQKSNIRYCFVLGAGASKSSGIRTGGELADIWFKDIQRIFPDQYEQWAKDKKVDKGDLASSYGKIYQKRFELHREQGYEFIQNEIAGSKPSYGYSILARLLGTDHNVVITTNFDPLTEDALFVYTDNRPLVCGHESLSRFVTPTTKRPIVVKVHRDQLLGPKNANDELSALEQGFSESLDRILQAYKPIVIGYGGNDPSLMNYFKTCNHLSNGMFWCKRPGDKLSSRITKLLELKGGTVFEIPGFDEFMFQINAAVFNDEAPLNEVMIGNAMTRGEAWGKQLAELSDRLKSPESREALSKVTKGKHYKTWWDVELAVNAVEDVETKDRIYLQGIAQFPQSSELVENYASFLQTVRKNYDGAEKYYLKALELDGDDGINNGNYAWYLQDVKKNYDEAEKYYLKALALDPDHPNNNGNYACFLHFVKKEYDEAENYYLKALELDPDHPHANGNYAFFLDSIRKNYEDAEKYYLRALELDPYGPRKNGNYADFLKTVRKNYDDAEEYYRKALEFDSDNANEAGNFAQFLIGRGKLSKAKTFLDAAFKNASTGDEPLLAELSLYQFANFPNDYPNAELELKKFVERGVTSEGWDFSENIDHARKSAHPNLAKVIEYAEKISGTKYS